MKRLVQVLLLAAWLAGVLPGGVPQGPSARDPDVLHASEPVRVVADTDLVRLTVGRTRVRLVVGPRDWATWRVSVSRPDVLSATTAPTARSPATPPQPH